MNYSDIIVAISTAAGVGGIAVVRVSGKGAIELVDTVFNHTTGKLLKDQKANTIHFGYIKKEDAVLDEVLVSIFRAPYSFTGEDVVEISCHGSIYIQQNILQLLITKGARLASAGEFTQRAFLNGKMDLSQAESVADLIASTSAATHRLAMNQMRGGFSGKLVELRTDLLNFTSLIELELDFSEEDVEFANRDSLKQAAKLIESHIKKLSDSFSLGNAIKTGIPVAIIGETNAGKSTLLNLLLHEDKAIVSDIHGTTRDVVEDTINIKGVSFRLIDTAGIRDTYDEIENLGIGRTFKKLDQASIVLWVVDIQSSDDHILDLSKKILPKAEGKTVILVFNKVDSVSPERLLSKEKLLQTEVSKRVFISAKYEENTSGFEDVLVEAANIPEFSENDVVVTNVRHYEALQNALSAIRRVIEGLDNGISGDFLSQDIRDCMHYLGEITGQISTDEILGNIFSKFCIGK
ncbi:tRNA uridine-5-carboxymethylaminomethyl(34) synthesis GTPase MnmE [Dysgonomonas sp. 216]|uniref:tRNA uridine-5-carboxymethylaminomethyl(34) synthesis GTPase MnmE n=1 Tax=Dysgonomonas sp. 216 TaxID=2302934 RepID=UPI0013D48549|nr:tRNA uridine-5-carboxymethylaminomethyl(34) synthesis GTPase MnmE [Dysgonomonas sp. 216]NDW17504.1 tRNA uridine-5-carboxymethylaminomethyl(34) synthesis GTPase MnmE [Dysgonomonas sp. 216]